jgi:hypothetical protein
VLVLEEALLSDRSLPMAVHSSCRRVDYWALGSRLLRSAQIGTFPERDWDRSAICGSTMDAGGERQVLALRVSDRPQPRSEGHWGTADYILNVADRKPLTQSVMATNQVGVYRRVAKKALMSGAGDLISTTTDSSMASKP